MLIRTPSNKVITPSSKGRLFALLPRHTGISLIAPLPLNTPLCWQMTIRWCTPSWMPAFINDILPSWGSAFINAGARNPCLSLNPQYASTVKSRISTENSNTCKIWTAWQHYFTPISMLMNQKYHLNQPINQHPKYITLVLLNSFVQNLIVSQKLKNVADWKMYA